MPPNKVGNVTALCIAVGTIALFAGHNPARALERFEGSRATGTSHVHSRLGNLSLTSKADGVLVANASRAGARLGVKTGDIITAIDALRVLTPEDLMAVLRSSVAQSHSLSVVRNIETRTVRISTAAWRPFLTPKPPHTSAPPASS